LLTVATARCDAAETFRPSACRPRECGRATTSRIKTLNNDPAVSFKVDNLFSLGGGFSWKQLKAELTNAVPGMPSGPLPGTLNGTYKGDVQAFGAQAAFAF
jgi:long-subunit fatty acid transport protein